MLLNIYKWYNSNRENQYNYTDTGATVLNTRKLYYRHKQVDKDGSYGYSQIVLLHLSRGNSVTVYPNPVSSIVTLSFSNKVLFNSQAVLTDIQGKQVIKFIINNYQEQIDMSHFSSGMYLLKLQYGTAIKLIKN
jgi:Secretion system C-terminal sorting domain